MNEQREDKEFEQYLDSGSSESRAYAELGDETPPPDLDAHILSEAERAAKVTQIDSRRAPPFKAFAWAAIVVLSFSLVLNIVFMQAVQDPVAELESMAGRFDAPSTTVGQKGSEELVVTARKRESASPEEAEMNVDQSTLVALTEEPPASIAVTSVPVPAGLDRDAQDVSALAMQVVADYLSEAESEGRRATASDDEDLRTELTRVLDSYNAGRAEEALAALAEFRGRHPEHSVSLILKERGF